MQTSTDRQKDTAKTHLQFGMHDMEVLRYRRSELAGATGGTKLDERTVGRYTNLGN